jgi:hypothetical protein
MINADTFSMDPRTYSLANEGVSKVGEIAGDKTRERTLLFEAQTFVCDGEYAKGLERILSAYLDGLNKPEQSAVWVSGFFGSGKSHLVKMLRYLWVDHKFSDGASIRSVATLPSGIKDLLAELSTRGRQLGGLRAAAGTLGAGQSDDVRLAFLQIIFRAEELPESYAPARFVLWLKEYGHFDRVSELLKKQKRDPSKEFRSFFVSTPLAEALAAVDPKLGDAKQALAALQSQFPSKESPTIEGMLDIIRRVYGQEAELPCTLLVVDEIQQFIGDKVQRAMDVQEIAESCSSRFGSRLLLVGTGQSALASAPNLGRLQARFTVKVALSDVDVQKVIRGTILSKKPESRAAIGSVIEANKGEVSRELQNTRLASTHADEAWYESDYPLLPVRGRFWERVLRNIDKSNTTAQLRSQMRIVYEATRKYAEAPLGTVIPGDFIYDQIAGDLLNTGELQREYHETIVSLRDGTPDGVLKSRLCALLPLIEKLPHTGAADDSVRATAEMLADLLVEDLQKDGHRLRQDVPRLLEELAAQGKVMQVESEYLLQTRDGAAWNHDFKTRKDLILRDATGTRIGPAREEILREALEVELRGARIQHGESREARRIELVMSQTKPQQPAGSLVLWVRHGWSEDECHVREESRAAGSEAPMLFGFLPREAHDELLDALASKLAAQETLEFRGTPGPGEPEKAKNAIETQLHVAKTKMVACVRRIMDGAKVFIGGGNEASGVQLVDKVVSAADSALARLFPCFEEADSARWPQVLSAAKAGNLAALENVGYHGEALQHPVLRRILEFLGAGRKGREVREHFREAPFGWSQDAIDAALVLLCIAGNLRVMIAGQSVDARSISQTQIGTASFHTNVPPLDVNQRLELKSLFIKLDVPTASGQESAAASKFLTTLLALADSAGGNPPLPEKPSSAGISELQGMSGNAQLLAIHQRKAEIEGWIANWRTRKQAIDARMTAWNKLDELVRIAKDLPAELPAKVEVAASVESIRSSRQLLTEPDPMPQLVQKIAAALRSALSAVHAELETIWKHEKVILEDTPEWKKLPEPRRHEIAQRFGLLKPMKLQIASDDELLSSLRENSIANRRNLVYALRGRFSQTLEEAIRSNKPEAAKIALPQVVVHSEQELDAWLKKVRARAMEQLKKGPAILS